MPINFLGNLLKKQLQLSLYYIETLTFARHIGATLETLLARTNWAALHFHTKRISSANDV